MEVETIIGTSVLQPIHAELWEETKEIGRHADQSSFRMESENGEIQVNMHGSKQTSYDSHI